MKYAIIALVVIACGVGVLMSTGQTVEVVNNVPQVVEKEVVREINPLDEQIKLREAELEEKYSKSKSLEARRDVLVAERGRLDAEIKQITVDLAGFMTATTSRR